MICFVEILEVRGLVKNEDIYILVVLNNMDIIFSDIVEVYVFFG